jgi:5'-deoxynucleotidase YfbR-like HD superfamily hydrolase
MIDMSIIHDLPESDISDLPNDVKIRFSNLKILLENLEIMSIKENLKDKYYIDLYIEFIELKTIESKIVKLADCISVQLYSEKEINLGNKNFNKILNRVNKEIKKIKNDIIEIVKIK